MAASKVIGSVEFKEKSCKSEDLFSDPWLMLRAGRTLAAAGILFAAAGPPYLALNGLLAFLGPPHHTRGEMHSTKQGSGVAADLPPHKLEEDNDALALESHLSALLATAQYCTCSSNLQAALEPSASLTLNQRGGPAEEALSTKADQGAATEDSNSEEGPDTPPLATPREPWEVAKQDLAVIDAAKVDGRESAGSKAVHGSGRSATAATQVAAAKASTMEQLGHKANRKLYKALKTGQVALRRKDFESALYHATKALEQNAKNVDALKFRVTVLVAQRKAAA